MPGTFEAFSQAGDTVTISASTTSANAAITPGVPHILVSNTTSNYVFITTGTAGVVANATKTPINKDSQAVINLPYGHTHVAAVTVAGSGTVYITPGQGV